MTEPFRPRHKLLYTTTGFTLLHSFHLTSLSNGSKPVGSLILSGSTLYGTTNYGGSVDSGTIFSISTSGTGFSVLHSFDAAPTNGKYPENSLILSGGYLYGATIGGGANGHGTIFRIGSDGSGFTLLHSFDGNSLSNGKSPRGTLLLSGSTLCGTTISGGPNDYGTIFSIATSGASFTVVHGFRNNTASDGETPQGSLILCGSALCGMTSAGGASDLGTIFSIGTDGSGFSLVHSFDGSTSSEGTWPVGNLTPNASGTKLYGMTTLGGANRVGTIFRIDIDGRNLTRLHSFDSRVASNAGQPQGSLLLSGSTLYGMTLDGGEQGSGAIFSIGTDGSGFTLIHSFSAEIGSPLGSLIISGGTLYGMTASNIFSVGTSVSPLQATSSAGAISQSGCA